jgi:hypothetical protein
MNLVALLVGWGVPAKLAKPLLIGLGILLFIGAIFAAVKIHDHRVVAQHEAQIQHRAAPATDQAVDRARKRHDRQFAKHEEEAHNAIHSVPDAAPAGPSHALACKRLRDLGRNPPACR